MWQVGRCTQSNMTRTNLLQGQEPRQPLHVIQVEQETDRQSFDRRLDEMLDHHRNENGAHN